MPQKECIPDLNDREFPSSIGHWQGDITWEPGPIKERFGLISCFLPANISKKPFWLKYQYIKIPKNTTIVVKFKAVAVFDPPTGVSIQWFLKDPTHKFLPYWDTAWMIGEWGQYLSYFLTPSDWDEEEGELLYENTNPWAYDGFIYYDEFSALYQSTAKIQYLPIMGVG
jgi:hypothetical protein